MKHTLIILALFLSGITASGQVTLVGEKAAKIVVNAGADATITLPATVQLIGKITGSPTDYYWTHNGMGSVADSTLKRTTYTPDASDTVVTFSLVGFYNFRGILDTIYDRRVVTIPE